MGLSEDIEAVLSIDPAQPALEFLGRWSTWGELQGAAQAIAAAIRSSGQGAGRRIGILMRNRAELVPAMLALLTNELCLATLNATAPDDKLAADILAVEVPLIVATEADWQRPGIVDAAAQAGSRGLSLCADGTVRFISDLPGEVEKWRRPDAPGIAIEMLSSGTTGTPKRIPLAYRSFERALRDAAGYERGREAGASPRLRSGVQIVTAPLAHISGMTGVMNNLLAGRKICLIERFTVEAFRDAVMRHRPKVAGAPPSALRMLLDADIPKEDFASLVAYRTGTAPLDPDLADAFYRRYGIPVLQNYGATEFAGGVAGWTIEDFHAHWTAKRGSVGRLNPGAEGRVVDPDSGELLPPGQEGLLELRAPNIGDGETWVRTTDLAVLDTDRFLWIRGRHDGAIIRGGFKILPEDVLAALEAHPAVREAAVVGIADRRLGAVPVAAYIPKSGATPPAEEEMRGWLKERLMPYQVPVRVLAVDELPRTPSMKVSQPALKALFEGLVVEA